MSDKLVISFINGSLLHIYEKQTTRRYKGDKRVYDVDFAKFCLRKVNVDPILCLGLDVDSIICEHKAQFFPHALHPFSLP
jgi:hypothetical protein